MAHKRWYPNSGKKWTLQELEKVYDLLVEQGYSVKSVALKYGRTPASMIAKLNRTPDLYVGMTYPDDWELGKKLKWKNHAQGVAFHFYVLGF